MPTGLQAWAAGFPCKVLTAAQHVHRMKLNICTGAQTHGAQQDLISFASSTHRAAARRWRYFPRRTGLHRQGACAPVQTRTLTSIDKKYQEHGFTSTKIFGAM